MLNQPPLQEVHPHKRASLKYSQFLAPFRVLPMVPPTNAFRQPMVTSVPMVPLVQPLVPLVSLVGVNGIILINTFNLYRHSFFLMVLLMVPLVEP